MDNNLDKVAKDLYGKIQTRFPNIKIGDENAAVLSKKSDIPNARFFEFEYEENGEPLGTITITLDEDDGIVIQVSGDLANDTSSSYHDAYSFIRSFRKFAKNRLLNFDVQNIGKSNLDKRDYMFQAKPKNVEPVVQPPRELPMMESKMFGTSRISYQDLGEARLVVKHNQPVNPEISGSRSMHIENIYIENADGERFKYPFKHLNGARALAEHIKHGGNPYDSIGKHITGLSEELAHLRKFKNYVGRQEQISEAMGSITNKVIERIDTVKKEIQQLQRSSYYETFVESFEEKTEQSIPEDIMNDWVDRLTVRTFNEELKAVFPYLYNIVETKTLPIRELNADDLLDESNFSSEFKYDNTIKTELLNPESMFESFIEKIVTEDKNELFSVIPGAKNKAINDFNILLSSEMAGGTSGVLALKGLIDDPELTSKIEVLNTDKEVRQEIKQYILDKDPEIIKLLPKLDSLKQSEIGGTDLPPSQPAPTAPAPTTQEPVPAPAPEPAAPAQVPAAPEPAPAPTPMAESKTKMKSKFIKAKTAGATLDTKFAEGMTIRDAIKECGLNPMECGFNDAESNESGVHQLLKIISGFWNSQEKNFTIGGERAKIKVVKAFDDGECPNASKDDVKKVLKLIDIKDPSQPVQSDDQHQILKLAGIKSVLPQIAVMSTDDKEHKLLNNLRIMKEQPISENEIDLIKRNAGLKK